MSQNPHHKPHQTENSWLKESPSQQVVQHAKYRSNFLLQTDDAGCSCPLILGRSWVARLGRRKGSITDDKI